MCPATLVRLHGHVVVCRAHWLRICPSPRMDARTHARMWFFVMKAARDRINHACPTQHTRSGHRRWRMHPRARILWRLPSVGRPHLPHSSRRTRKGTRHERRFPEARACRFGQGALTFADQNTHT